MKIKYFKDFIRENYYEEDDPSPRWSFVQEDVTAAITTIYDSLTETPEFKEFKNRLDNFDIYEPTLDPELTEIYDMATNIANKKFNDSATWNKLIPILNKLFLDAHQKYLKQHYSKEMDKLESFEYFYDDDWFLQRVVLGIVDGEFVMPNVDDLIEDYYSHTDEENYRNEDY